MSGPNYITRRFMYRMDRIGDDGAVLYRICESDKPMSIQARMQQLGFDHDSIVNAWAEFANRDTAFSVTHVRQANGWNFIVCISKTPIDEIRYG